MRCAVGWSDSKASIIESSPVTTAVVDGNDGGAVGDDGAEKARRPGLSAPIRGPRKTGEKSEILTRKAADER